MKSDELKSWKALEEYYLKEGKTINILDEFKKDPKRASTYSLEYKNEDNSVQVFLDYSKNLINSQCWSLLMDLLKESKALDKRDEMFAGKHINITEDRAVLHLALRNVKEALSLTDNGQEVMADVKKELLKAKDISDNIREQKWLGYTGKPIKSIVNIGIGGSDLGPVMVVEALKHYKIDTLNFYFVSNVDGTHLTEVLKVIDQETTLFIIASKTFTTQETILNATSAKRWFLEKAKDVSY